MTRFTPPYFVNLFLCIVIFSFISCASEVFESETQEVKCRISTAINIEQVKTSDDLSISRSADRAPKMRTFKVEGAKGEMFMRYTAAAGIYGKNISEMEQDNNSRGKMITNGDFYDDYGLFAYEYPSTQTWNSVYATATPSIVNERVLKSTSWMTNEYWPGVGSRLAFYGYAPYNATGVTNLPTASTTGKPKFRYTVPTDATVQNDLLVSEDDAYIVSTNEKGGVDVPGNYNAIKTLRFKHACTAVRLAVGEKMAPCTIKKIAIKGVYGAADYNYGAGSNLNEGAWQNFSPDLCDYELNADLVVSATDQNKVINDGKYAFMLLPQIVPDGATIEITLNDGEEHVIKANISGSEWKMGYSVTYFLTTSTVDYSYVLTVSSPGAQIPGEGGSSTMSVQSYKQTFYGSQVAVPWIASYTIGDDPTIYTSEGSAVTAFTHSGNGSTISQNYTITFGSAVPLSDPTTNSHTAELRSREVVTNVNLAAGGETANCYVVTAPGTYSFPLVWGNAIKNGVANPSAYTSTNSPTPFVDYMGTPITTSGPYIYDSYTPHDAVIVWQDAPNLITPSSVKLSDDKKSIEFEVKKDNICQGNCVIAVRDENKTIMWSWHIWVTDYDWEETIEMKSNEYFFNFMNVPSIGFCDAETRTTGNKTKIKFIISQKEGTVKASTEYELGIATEEFGNNTVYFQFGRKDPMTPSTGLVSDDNKPVINYEYLQSEINTTDIKTTIRFPYCLNTSQGNTSLELWNVGNTVTSINYDIVQKSIFDPSPVGYNLPCSGAFQGWNSSGRYYFQNTTGQKGVYIYQYDSALGNPVFFAITGGRRAYSSTFDNNDYGYCRTAGPSSTDYGYYMYFSKSDFAVARSNQRYYAFPVRPIKY